MAVGRQQGRVSMGRQKRTDYIFRYRPDYLFAAVEVKAHYKQASETQAGAPLGRPERVRMRNPHQEVRMRRRCSRPDGTTFAPFQSEPIADNAMLKSASLVALMVKKACHFSGGRRDSSGFCQARGCYLPMLRPRDLLWVWRSSSSAVSFLLEWRST